MLFITYWVLFCLKKLEIQRNNTNWSLISSKKIQDVFSHYLLIELMFHKLVRCLFWALIDSFSSFVDAWLNWVLNEGFSSVIRDSICITRPIDFVFKAWSGDKDSSSPKRLFWLSTSWKWYFKKILSGKFWHSINSQVSRRGGNWV